MNDDVSMESDEENENVGDQKTKKENRVDPALAPQLTFRGIVTAAESTRSPSGWSIRIEIHGPLAMRQQLVNHFTSRGMADIMTVY